MALVTSSRKRPLRSPTAFPATGPRREDSRRWGARLARLPGLLALPLLAAGCTKPAAPPLPPLPAVDLAGFEPAVRAQIEGALNRALRAPEDAARCGELARLLHAYDWIEAATALYERARRLDPGDSRWPYYEGRLLLRLGRVREARESLLASYRCRPDYLPCLLVLGDTALEEGDAAGAERWFRDALGTAPDSPHARTGLGRALLARGELEGALRAFQEALEKAPGFGPALHALARLQRARGQAAAAQRLLEGSPPSSVPPPDPLLGEVQALRADADHFLRAGTRLFKRGDPAGALELFSQALERDPGSSMARYNIARALQALGRHEEAIPHYRRLLEEKPENTDARNNLALAHYHLGRHQEARRELEEVLRQEPGAARGHLNLAIVDEGLGEAGRAEAAYLRALELDPRNREAHLGLGALLGRRGRPAEAAEHLLAVLREEPGEARAREALRSLLDAARRPEGNEGPSRATPAGDRRLAEFLREKGLRAAAVAALRDGLSQRPDWQSQVALAWLLAGAPEADRRGVEEAIRILEPLCRTVAAGDPAALDTLAMAYAASGRFEDARRTAERALELARTSTSEAHRKLAPRIEKRLELYHEEPAVDGPR